MANVGPIGVWVVIAPPIFRAGAFMSSGPTSCHHLRPLLQLLLDVEVVVLFSGQAWTKAGGVWVYFECWLDRDHLRERFHFDSCVVDHEHLGTHSGQEAGFVCEACGGAVMGVHARFKLQYPVFR